MLVIINGEVSFEGGLGIDPPDRVIRLPNLSLELERTPEGGWAEKSTMYDAPDGGSGAGHSLAALARIYPWVGEQLWRRIVALEDELNVLRRSLQARTF